MRTAFQTGPGLYAAESSNKAKHLPPATLRVYCARLEAYDLPLREGESSLNDISFEILFAKASGNPDVARALLQLGEAIKGNVPLLQEIVRKGNG